MNTSTKPTHIVCPHCDAVNRIPYNRLNNHPNCGKCKQSLFTAHPIELTDANFQTHLQRNDIPIIVDFWASWCGPCQMMAPAFEEAAQRLEPYVRLAKLNTESHQMSASQYGIRSIPTIIMFKNGVEVSRQSGALNSPQIIQWIQNNHHL